MTYAPQHIRIRNLLLSANKQNAYGTAIPDANLLVRPRMDGSNFVVVSKQYHSDDGRSNKGHDFPTVRNKIEQDVAMQLNLELTDEVAGWLGAFFFGNVATSGVGVPYTHLFTFLPTINMPVTSIYTEDTNDVKSRALDIAIAEMTINLADRGPLIAQANLMGSGRITDGALGNALPDPPQPPKYMYGQDTHVLVGAPGAAADISDRIRSLQIKFTNTMSVLRAPGSATFGVVSKVMRQRVTVAMKVAADSADDLRGIFLADTTQELQMNHTTAGGDNELKIKLPNFQYSAAPYGVDGQEVVFDVATDEQSTLKVGTDNYVEFTVINSQAAYLVGA